MNDMQIPPEIRSFLEGLLEDAGVKAEGEMKEEMLRELFQRLDTYIITSIVEKLPPENLDEFIKMNEEKRSKEEIEQFVKAHVPSASEFFADTFLKFRQLYLGGEKTSPVDRPAQGE